MQQSANNGCRAALDNLEHMAFGAPFAVHAHHAHAHAVAVQHTAHLLRRQVDDGLAVVAHGESMAVAVAFDAGFGLAEQGADRRRQMGWWGFFDAIFPVS